jgi:hypothetical protein
MAYGYEKPDNMYAKRLQQAASQGTGCSGLAQEYPNRISLISQLENRVNVLNDKARMFHSILSMLREHPEFEPFLELRDESLL